MEESLEDIRRDIENTRFALGEKLGRLEHKIEITTKQTLNPAYYVRTRPWPTLGAFAVLGWMVGRALKPKRNRTRHSAPPTLAGSVPPRALTKAWALLFARHTFKLPSLSIRRNSLLSKISFL